MGFSFLLGFGVIGKFVSLQVFVQAIQRLRACRFSAMRLYTQPISLAPPGSLWRSHNGRSHQTWPQRKACAAAPASIRPSGNSTRISRNNSTSDRSNFRQTQSACSGTNSNPRGSQIRRILATIRRQNGQSRSYSTLIPLSSVISKITETLRRMCAFRGFRFLGVKWATVSGVCRPSWTISGGSK